MPDITMCGNVGCTQKATCYRYRAKPSNYQSYSTFNSKKGACEHFVAIEETDEICSIDEANQRSVRYIIAATKAKLGG